jgi:hypothetical protein
MNSYFFKMNKQERENILDQHRHVYDGYVTKYNQQSNQYPLYVQDLANDKNGITVNNKGLVKTYTNVGINEGLLDMIADGPMDLENGTIDIDSVSQTNSINKKMLDQYYPSPNEEEEEFVTYGKISDEEEIPNTSLQNLDRFEYDIDELEDYSASNDYDNTDEEDLTYSERLQNTLQNVDEEILPELVQQLYESRHMFERFKKYN